MLIFVHSFIHVSSLLRALLSQHWLWVLYATPQQIPMKLSPNFGNVYNSVLFNVYVHTSNLFVLLFYYCWIRKFCHLAVVSTTISLTHVRSTSIILLRPCDNNSKTQKAKSQQIHH